MGSGTMNPLDVNGPTDTKTEGQVSEKKETEQQKVIRTGRY